MKQNAAKCRVLLVNTTEFGPGGITKVIETYYRAIPDQLCDFDIVAINSPIPSVYRRLFEERGSAVYYLPRKKNLIKYVWGLLRVCAKGKYDAIHVHGNSATMAIELLVAFLCAIRKRIAHCHTSSCEHKKAHKLLMPLFSRLYTRALACSETAGNWIFGKGRFAVLNNAVDSERYVYSGADRDRYREELSISPETLVLGHIGYFNETKNQSFLVELMPALRAKRKVKMVFVGIGDLQEQVCQNAEQLGLLEDVLFLGVRDDVANLLQAMDVFLFPSKWEGLGIALLEAQLSGLRCIASEHVPQEANISGLVAHLPLDEPDLWVHAVLEEDSVYTRADRSRMAVNASKEKGYDIALQAQKLMEIYCQ